MLTHNRHALIVDRLVTQAVGIWQRDAAKEMAADRPGAHQKAVRADKGYDTKGFVAEIRRMWPRTTLTSAAPPLTGAAPHGRRCPAPILQDLLGLVG